jgi:hypothetical protein
MASYQTEHATITIIVARKAQTFTKKNKVLTEKKFNLILIRTDLSWNKNKIISDVKKHITQ